MAVFARVAPTGAKVGQFVGRDLAFVLLAKTGIQTNYTNVDSDFEKAVRILQLHGTMTIVGTPDSGNVIFVMEGLSNRSTKANIEADLTAAGVTGCTITLLAAGLKGNTVAAS